MAEKDGLYEELMTEFRAEALSDMRICTEPIQNDSEVLRLHLERICLRAMREVFANQPTGASSAKARSAVTAANRILDVLHEYSSGAGEVSPIRLPAELLLAVESANGSRSWASVRRPATAFSEASLFTGGHNEPKLYDELVLELESAERADFLVSFIKKSGVNLLREALQSFCLRGGKLRVATTTYLGASDASAIEELAHLPNSEIYVSYGGGAARHHAKAYIFVRPHQLSTAYVGSANLSNAALNHGLEWTLKCVDAEQPRLVERMRAMFEAAVTADGVFERYRPGVDAERLSASLEAERHPQAAASAWRTAIPPFELTPRPYQEEILEKLEADEVLHGKTRSLVEAATGTGKTMIAAFDYRRWLDRHPKEDRFLFVAHRREILEQALGTFRAVLKDANFGSILGRADRIGDSRHLFLSVQLASRRDPKRLFVSDDFDYVVVDEFHHAAADSYRSLLDHLKPKRLLGLTATPFRTDGLDILRWFGGEISATLSLADAIDRGHLARFTYWMVSDPVSLEAAAWKRGSYLESELERLYVDGSQASQRAGTVLEAVRRYFPEEWSPRILAFCVSRRHAEFMAKFFTRSGFDAVVVDGRTPEAERTSVPCRLADGRLQIVFTVDVFNEGVDIPDVNAVLFLRPTASPVVFLQQLGRGLRRTKEKEELLVLDFVGAANRCYSFESKLRALTGGRAANVRELVEGDGHTLPAGCIIRFERVAKEHVLRNLRQHRSSVGERLDSIAEWVGQCRREGREPRLSGYLRDAGISFAQWCLWSAAAVMTFQDALDRVAGRRCNGDSSWTKASIGRVCSLNAMNWLSRLLSARASAADDRSTTADWKSLAWAFWEKEADVHDDPGAEIRRRTEGDPRFAEELFEMLEAAREAVDFVPPSAGAADRLLPFELHARYFARQALAMLGDRAAKTFQSGVRHLEEKNLDIFFVTIEKSGSAFTEATRYNDYAMNARRFHWESQHMLGARMKAAERYRKVSFNKDDPQALLFVRERKTGAQGLTEPFVYLGRVAHVRSSGEYPVSIVWALEHPLSARLLEAFSR